jgi:hypothetical protein
LLAEDEAEEKRIDAANQDFKDLLEAAEKAEEERRKREKEARRRGEEEERAFNSAKEQREAILAERLKEHNRQIVADYLTVMLSEEADYEPVLTWESEQPTKRQLDVLGKAGFDVSLISSRGLASKLIESMGKRRERGLATFKQVSLMRRLAYPGDAAKATFAEAHAWIEERLNKKKAAAVA